MTWQQSVNAFQENKINIKEVLKTNFNTHKNVVFCGRCMKCSESMKEVKRTNAIQLCEYCWNAEVNL